MENSQGDGFVLMKRIIAWVLVLKIKLTTLRKSSWQIYLKLALPKKTHIPLGQPRKWPGWASLRSGFCPHFFPKPKDTRGIAVQVEGGVGKFFLGVRKHRIDDCRGLRVCFFLCVHCCISQTILLWQHGRPRDMRPWDWTYLPSNN